MQRTLQFLTCFLIAATTNACGSDGSDGSPPGTPDGSTESVLPARVEAIVHALDTAMHQCPDRAWPGSGEWYRDRSQILLASETGGSAYLWNDLADGPQDEPTITVIDAGELSGEWFSFFNVGEIGGVATVGISLDATAEINEYFEQAGVEQWHDFATTLAFHEGFHFLSEQTVWPPQGGSRAAPYPEKFEPRYLRAALIRATVESASRDEAVPEIAHWQQRFAAEHPTQRQQIRGTDIVEGSAEYTTIVMSAIAELGCEATEEALMALMLEHTGEGFGSYSADGESYELGVAAGLVLRNRGPQGWEGRVAGGEPPIEILVDGVAADVQPDDEELSAAIEEVIAERNAANASLIEPVLESMASADEYRLPLPSAWGAGSFSTSGFLQLVDEPGQPEAILSLSAQFASPNGGAQIEVRELTALTLTTPAPCGGAGEFVVTIRKSDVTETGGTFSASTDTLIISGLGATIATADGLDWLCPGQAQSASRVPHTPVWREWSLLRRLSRP